MSAIDRATADRRAAEFPNGGPNADDIMNAAEVVRRTMETATAYSERGGSSMPITLDDVPELVMFAMFGLLPNVSSGPAPSEPSNG